MKSQPLLDLLAREPSPYEANGMADLIQPFQIELIADFCQRLKTKPQVEASALFGKGVSFHRLSQRAADALTVELRNVYVRQYGLPK